MDERELIGKVHSAVYCQCQQRGYAAPADVLVDIGVLPKQKYEDWRFGKVQYLEQVCTCNLKKLSFIMKQIRSYAKKAGLKPSFCYYKRWGVKKKQGHKPVIPLRDSRKNISERMDLAAVLSRIIMKYLCFSVFRTACCVTVLRSYRHWCRLSAILSCNHGSSDRFAVPHFFAVVTALFPLSAIS